MKLTVIMVLLIVSVITVTGTFLINSATSYQMEGFRTQMAEVFTTELIDTLNQNSKVENAALQLKEIVNAYSGALGIDTSRNFYVLNGTNGGFICGSDAILGRNLEKTPNVIKAISGQVGDHTSFTETYMDVAVPVGSGDSKYIIYIKDDKQKLRDLNWMLFTITVQAMLFGLVVAVFLSFFLSKTLTNPIENLTRGACLVAAGKFSNKLPVHSDDEIGELTKTFNSMAQILEQTIQKAENERDKLNTIFLHMADGVAAFTGDGSMLHINPAAERMLRVSFSPSLKFKQVFDGVNIPSISESKQHSYIESEYEKNGRRLKLLFANFNISENEKGVMTVIRDITEESRLEAARREFVANVSHELRTPLTNIKSYTETLELDGDAIPAETRSKFLRVITNEADRMTRIVSDLLTLSKLDYGKLDLKIERFSLKNMLEGVYNAMVLTAKNSGCALTLDIDEQLPDILGDRERIAQVAVNIISNAIKFTPEGGRISISAFKDKEYAVICVKDTGIGIPKEDIPRLFERFYRVEKARSRESGGTGLGLAIAKEIVECHNGSITVESEVNQGTKVTISLPLNNKD